MWRWSTNGDVVRQVEPPAERGGAVPATIVNWDGDEGVEYRELLDYMSELSGVRPGYEEREGCGSGRRIWVIRPNGSP